MKKLLNKPEQFVAETIEGIIAAYGDRVNLIDGDTAAYVSCYPAKDGKVGVVTAGGSGHLPVFLGYVGQGMLDGCAVGNVFASPSAAKMEKVIRACDRGSGVLCVFGNYGGDKMNFEMACEMVEMDDIETRSVLVKDDLASSPLELSDRRRGVAGMVYAFKIAGAAAEQMMSLDEVAGITNKALSNIRTMGVALSPCIVPMVGKPGFSIAEDKMEVGMGIHGEPGIEVCKMMSADDTVDMIMDKLLSEIVLDQGDEVSVMVNGLGATPLEEQFIVYRRIKQILDSKGVSVVMPHIGEFATSMEMAGLSITLFKLDDQLKALLEAPANTPFYTNANK